MVLVFVGEVDCVVGVVVVYFWVVRGFSDCDVFSVWEVDCGVLFYGFDRWVHESSLAGVCELSV